MPKRNTTGGKAFKKGRKVVTDGDVDDKRFDGLEAGQDLGRVTKLLGNRRVLCFCGSDSMERVCKIRGVLCKGPKKQRIDISDVVLISNRDYAATTYVDSEDKDEDEAKDPGVKVAEGGAVTASGKRDVYDLIYKLSASQIRDARRTQKDLNSKLFDVGVNNRVDATLAFEFGDDSDDGHTDKRDKIRHRVSARDEDNDGGRPAAEEMEVDVDAI